LLRDEYVVLLPPQVERPKGPLTWEQLASYPMIMPPDHDYCTVLIRDHLNRWNQPIKAAYKISEDSTIVGMVLQGLGITIMARLAAHPLPPEIQVCQLPVPLERVIRVALLADALHPPAVFAFLETLKSMSQINSATIAVGNEMVAR
jgi:DNA-binding transcriptional LysR family regulator